MLRGVQQESNMKGGRVEEGTDRFAARSIFTLLRYAAPEVEMDYIGYCYGGSVTLHTSVVAALLCAVLVLAESIAVDWPNTEYFILVVAGTLALCASLAMWLSLWCFRMAKYPETTTQSNEALRIAYVMECVGAATLLIVLSASGYVSFAPPILTASLQFQDSTTVSPHGTSFNALYTALVVMTTAVQRPRCVFVIPIVCMSLGAMVAGFHFSCAEKAWLGLSGADAQWWSVQRDLQFGFSISLAVVCCAFRAVREWQHRRHFQQHNTLCANRDRMQQHERELMKIVERFVPALKRHREPYVIATNVKAVCCLFEIVQKEYLLPTCSKDIQHMAKVVTRLEQTIRRQAEGNGIERIAFEGDTFCCTSGLDRLVDEYGTRTIDGIRCGCNVLAEVAKWNVPHMLGAADGVGRSPHVGTDDDRESAPEEDDLPPLALHVALHIGPLQGFAIGRATLHYTITGECLMVAQGMLQANASPHMMISRNALEACGGRVRVSAAPNVAVVVGGHSELLNTFYVINIDQQESNEDEETPKRGPILDLLVTPPFEATSEENKRDSTSLLAELAGERSAFSGAPNISMSAPSTMSGPEGALCGPFPTRRQHQGEKVRKPKHCFYDAIQRDVAASAQLERDIGRCKISNRWIAEHFEARDQEERFFRVRGAWHTPMRGVLLVVMSALVAARWSWKWVMRSLCRRDETPPCFFLELSEGTELGTTHLPILISEVAILCSCWLIFVLRTVAFRRFCASRLLLFYVRGLETMLIGVLLLILTGHYFMMVSTWSRQLPTLPWIILLCQFYSYIPVIASYLFGGMTVVTATIFYSISTHFWRGTDIVQLLAMVTFFAVLNRAEERQDRRFFSEALIARASALAQRKKQVILGGVLRATIPNLLHTFHNSLLDKRPSLGSSSGNRTLVVMHEHLVVTQIMWRNHPHHTALDRVSMVERCVQDGNDLMDSVLRRKKGQLGVGSFSDSDSETDGHNGGGGASGGDQQSQRPSICIMRCLGDVVTIAGLPVTGDQSLPFGGVEMQVAALVAAVLYAIGRLSSQEPPASLSAAVSLGIGISVMSYEDVPKYAMAGTPLTQSISLLRSGAGGSGCVWATTNAVSALGEMCPDEVVRLSPDGTQANNITVRVGASKRWRVKGLGAIDVHMISFL